MRLLFPFFFFLKKEKDLVRAKEVPRFLDLVWPMQLDKRGLSLVIHALGTSSLHYCNMLCGDPLRLPGHRNWSRMRLPILLTGLDSTMRCRCFVFQFKVLVLTDKALHGFGPGYLKDCSHTDFCMDTLADQDHLRAPRLREAQLVGTREKACSMWPLSSGISSPRDARSASGLLTF